MILRWYSNNGKPKRKAQKKRRAAPVYDLPLVQVVHALGHLHRNNNTLNRTRNLQDDYFVARLCIILRWCR